MKTYIFTISTLLMMIFLLSFISCSNNSTSTSADETQPEPQNEAIITLDNNGANAYHVTNIEGEGAESELNTPNAEIALEIGGRYTFINNGGASSHPLDFRNDDNEKLLGQSNSSGSFDNDNEVNVTRNGDAITFTLTESLSEALFDYICSFHPQ